MKRSETIFNFDADDEGAFAQFIIFPFHLFSPKLLPPGVVLVCARRSGGQGVTGARSCGRIVPE